MYWIEAVKLFDYEKPHEIQMITGVYWTVAKKMKTTSSRVERALRHAIETHKDEIKSYFNVKLKKLTNKDFLFLLAYKVKEGEVK